MNCHITALSWKEKEQRTMPGIFDLMLKHHPELQGESFTLVQMHLQYCTVLFTAYPQKADVWTVTGVNAPFSQRSAQSNCWLCTEYHLLKLSWLRPRVT